MIKIYSADGFIREFWQRAKDYKYLKQAYESLEKEHIEIFGKRKYSDYDSFRVCRDRKVKKAQNHKII